jgi:hypothetical protein
LGHSFSAPYSADEFQIAQSLWCILLHPWGEDIQSKAQPDCDY